MRRHQNPRSQLTQAVSWVVLGHPEPPGDYFWPLMAVPVLFIYTLMLMQRLLRSIFLHHTLLSLPPRQSRRMVPGTPDASALIAKQKVCGYFWFAQTCRFILSPAEFKLSSPANSDS